MAKTKKLLCLALAIALVSSLLCMPASAEVSTPLSATFENENGSEWSTGTSKGNYSLTSSVYGKDSSDYSAKSPANTAADRYFNVTSTVTVPSNGKLKISYDMASNAFDEVGSRGNNGNTHGRYAAFKINNGGYQRLLQPNDVTFDTQMAAGIYDNLNEYAWNNVTAILEFADKNGTANGTANYKLYINGKLVYSNASFEKYAPWTTINGARVGGITIESDEVYYDNILIETYEAADATPSVAFASSATSLDVNVKIDDANKKVSVASDLTAKELKEKTTNLVLIDATGNIVGDDVSVTDASVKLYAKYTNGINMYYEPYTVEIIPPVITGNNTVYQEIINNDTKEIRLVDMPNLTVGSFMDNVTNTGTLSITKDGEAAADSDLLKDCTVNLTLGNVYDYTYTVVTERSYLLKKETFDGTFTTRTSSGTVYSGNDFVWTGNTNGISGVTFGELTGLGDKEADDSSLGITVNGASADKEIFTYISTPYINSSKVINTTHTLETKIYLDGVDAADFSAIDFCINGRNLLKIFPDGSIKHTDGTVATGVKWTAGEWIPVAVTYHKATNIIDVYVGGKKIACTWNPAPNGTDIRFRPWVKKDAAFTFAMDDVKFYTDSLAKVRYEVDSANTTVVADATENLATLPIIAEYDSTGKLLGVTLGKSEKTISRNYAADSKVKVILINSLDKLEAITAVYEAVR